MPSTLPVLVVNEPLEISSTGALLQEATVDVQGSVNVTSIEIQALTEQGSQQLFQLKRIAAILACMAGVDFTETDL